MQTDKRNGIFRFILTTFGISILAYLVLISNELTNTYDGMWQGSYYRSYPWVVQIGRWFWPAIGKALLDMEPEPVTSVISLLFYMLGGYIFIMWFGVKNTVNKYLIVLSIVINTTVCVTLSYRFMSPVFAISFFLSVLGIWIIHIPDWKRLILSVIIITLSLGCFQTNLGCSCVLLILWFVKLLCEEKEMKKIIRFLLYAAGSILVSCVLYKITWEIFLNIYNTTASTYRGADSASIINMITSLPKSIGNTYRSFYNYFFAGSIRYNAYQSYIWFKILIVFFMVYSLYSIYRQTIMKKRFIFAVLSLLLIPAAANIALILSPENNSTAIHMAMPIVIVLPCLFSFAYCKSGNKWEAIPGWFAVFFTVFLIFGSFLMVSVDQHVMLTGRQTSVSIMNRVASDIDWNNEPEYGYIFLGRISDNPMFRKDPLWNKANAYARYGNFWIGGNCGTQSYYGLLRDSGLNMTMNWNDSIWHQLEKIDFVQNMPVFPYPGYIQKIDTVTVIKFSNNFD